MDQKKTGSFLRELRKEKQLTQEPLCVKMGDWQQHAGSQYPGGTGRFL